ncbi:hypothetical protein CNECB9_2200034 [Cupriavidus necator]|uniref:Uncharacterized protein n=1 Tax=Cupriavidus necator TaxID=106590 RepID=A0A1K0JAV3_CUPNE|nr:hypothetical protein CNECB9_2200034 [Cupriavidus necator]
MFLLLMRRIFSLRVTLDEDWSLI